MIVLDTESLLIFYLGEVGADVVEDLLKKVLRGDIKGYLNVINLTEFYYILYRKDPMIADEKVGNLRAYGLQIVPVTDDSIWREAGRLKGMHSLSLADAFAAATASVKGSDLVVGSDREFDGIGVPLMRVR
ncbi:type II toxin-antitoxin system VapC family toxin [ANME-2 cluster archaeon]|nr:MAG: type II toxin-antitoxin system VapC family toxin [ANME-2 cluster archaeon]